MFTITRTVECYLLPEDGSAAEALFLQHLKDPYESQSTGITEKPQVARLVTAGVEVTVGTSPAGTSYITHTKGVTCSDVPVPWCWEGP